MDKLYSSLHGDQGISSRLVLPLVYWACTDNNEMILLILYSSFHILFHQISNGVEHSQGLLAALLIWEVIIGSLEAARSSKEVKKQTNKKAHWHNSSPKLSAI